MIRIGVSACLMGKNVRYDGNNKFIELSEFFNANHYKLVAICPEVEMGMPIPRPPIHIINNNQIKLLQVNDHNIDYTKGMKSWFIDNYDKFNQYKGFILKSKSPSCGHQTTPHFQTNEFFLADGLFVSLLKKQNPNIALIDEKQICNSLTLTNFIQNIAN